MLKAYMFGFVGATLAVAIGTVIWFGTQTGPEPTLRWGDNVYTSKQEFEGYLRSKGLNYETWAARHSRASSPWEPNKITIGAITVRASTATREAWVIRLSQVAVGLMLAAGVALLLLRGLRSLSPGLATKSMGLAGALLAVLLVAGLLIGTQPTREPGLLWGGRVYTTKQQFSGYLKSKGLSYKTWVARNPGAAPWEPGVPEAPRDARGPGVARLLLAATGITLAAGCGLLLFRRLRRFKNVVSRSSGAITWPRTPRLDLSSGPALAVRPSLGRLGAALFDAARRLKLALPLLAVSFARPARTGARRVVPYIRGSRVDFGYLTVCLIGTIGAAAFAILVVSLLTP